MKQFTFVFVAMLVALILATKTPAQVSNPSGTANITAIGGVATATAANASASGAGLGGVIGVMPMYFDGTNENRTISESSATDATNGTNIPITGLQVFNGATWDKLRGSGTTGSVNVENVPTITTADSLTSTILTTLTASQNVKASPGNVYGMSIVNGAATVCYAQFLNSAGAGTLGSAVIFAVALPGSGVVNIPPGVFSISNFSTGIAVGLATTANTNSACGTAGNATIFYK